MAAGRIGRAVGWICVRRSCRLLVSADSSRPYVIAQAAVDRIRKRLDRWHGDAIAKWRSTSARSRTVAREPGRRPPCCGRSRRAACSTKSPMECALCLSARPRAPTDEHQRRIEGTRRQLLPALRLYKDCAVTCNVSLAWFCRWLMTASRLPAGPNMRIRLFGDGPVSAPSCSKPTVVLM